MKKFIIILLLLVSGCATAPAVKSGFNFNNYKRIGIVRFVSHGEYKESGSAVSDEFIRQFIKRNISIVEIQRSHKRKENSYQIIASEYDVDAVLSGTVTRYIPDGEETVYFKNEENKIVSEVFFKEAQLGISVKLIDGKSGEVVWSDTYYYSGFEMSDTISTTVDIMLTRLIRGRS